MANLPEASEFTAGVYQIETTDPVVGGVDGIANLAARSLASRTRWLKDQIDGLAASLAGAFALKTGDYAALRARATTKADVGLGSVEDYPPTDSAAGGETNKVTTPAAVKGYVDPLIAASALKTWESPDVAIVSGGAFVLDHTLGGSPFLMQIFLRCAVAEHGYEVGELAPMAMLYEYTTIAAMSGVSLIPGAAQIRGRFTSQPNPFYVIRPDTGQSAIPTKANWRLVVRAIR
jgi:hypothetical protein